MVQFVQSHSVNPSGNAEKNLPTLVSSRDALLLFTPQGAPVGKISVEVQLDGASKHTAVMAAPFQLPATDNAGTFGRPDVAYSKRAWSTVLPWSVVKPGMSLVFRDESGQSAALASSAIEMSAPARLVLWGIRLGMLTAPPPVNEGEQPMLTNTAVAATDYFQTIPVSQLIVASYEDVTLDKVMLADGAIRTGASTQNGDVYGGDLRENVGKSQFSIGIGLANYGVTSSINGRQDSGGTTPQLVYHHSAGNYANGRQTHGLSGGGAVATLYGSYGNEWSHELGHHYGLGHYPGQEGNDGFWTRHHADSGWGYIGHRKRMRSNLMFEYDARIAEGVNPQDFLHLYLYLPDAMSGGWTIREEMLTRYTHYTGYTAKRIQDFVSSRAWFDPDSATGYSRWDADNAKVVSVAPPDRAPPTRFGVPVFTLLGGYDPSNNTAVMYPPARGNYGMVFDKLSVPDSAAPAACWLDVRFANGTGAVALAASRIDKDSANKFHVNIAQADQPQSAALFCRNTNQTKQLGEVVFPQNLPAMKAAVVVGESAGYGALAEVELPQLEAGLQAMAGDGQPIPDRKLDLLLDSWRERTQKLTASTAQIASLIERTRASAEALDRWMTDNAAGLDAKTPATVAAWRTQLAKTGLVSGTGYADAFGQVSGDKDGCMALSSSDPKTAKLVRLDKSACALKPEQLWLHDKRGALRSAALPGHCVNFVDSNDTLEISLCNSEAVSQVFTYKDDEITPVLWDGGACGPQPGQ